MKSPFYYAQISALNRKIVGGGKVHIRSIAPVLLLWLCCLSTCLTASLVAQQPKDSEFLKQQTYSGITEFEEQDFERLGQPMPGEWLFEFPESGQTLEQYKAKDTKSILLPKRRTIVLQPLGEFSAEEQVVLEALQDYAHSYFQLKTRIAKPIRMPDPAKSSFVRKSTSGTRINNREYQYEATAIVNQVLLQKVPSDAVVYLGITMSDLYAADLNFVFGFGSFENRAGVYSLARYFPEFWNEASTEKTRLQTLRRSFKVLNHETSHVFGLRHCIFYDCTMNGSISLDETDRASIHECPICHQKLLWNLKFDPRKRFESLQTTYTKFGLLEEAAWIEKRNAHWQNQHNPSAAKR